MDIVHLLPDNVANQIAAGEVIQRPSSCLKELVENSIDAGATTIQVIVRDAGKTLLQVIDNGSGMSETDARMAFERHATSKIREASDLFRLTTMGFRGEALASICAVAQVEMTTRRAEDEIGTCIEINGSTVVRQEPVQCPVGTNFKVKNLFYNVVARRRFLKTDATELRNLIQDFYRIVLVYPEIQFTFVHNDEIILELPKANHKQRIEQVFGRSNRAAYSSQLVEINVDTDIVHIHGFVGKPENAGKQSSQYFFTNGRYMRHPVFHKAITQAYQGMLIGEASPSYFVYFDINPDEIDVNIHPTKTEIKFLNEQIIFRFLTAAVREALGKFDITPSLDFDTTGQVEMPVQTNEKRFTPQTMPRITAATNYNPFNTVHKAPGAQPELDQWQSLYPEPEPSLFEPHTALSDPYQYASRYILLPTTGGLMLIDQHRAHACVLYDIYMRQMHDHRGERQQLLFPEVLEVPTTDIAVIESMLNDLMNVGFELVQLSPTSYTVSSVPSLLSGQNAIEVLQEIIEDTHLHHSSVQEEWQQHIAWSLASHTAIRSGKPMNIDEMRQLLEQLWKLPSYARTPDGKKVTTLLSDDEIGRKFC